MKPSRIFWGMVFITLGGFFLLKNAFDVDVTLSALGKLWPIAIVLLGLLLMFKQVLIRAALAGLVGIWVGWFVFFVVSFGWIHAVFDETEEADAIVQEIVEPLEAGVQRATFRLSTGFGRIAVDSTSNNLCVARIKSSLAQYELDRNTDDGEIHLNLREKHHVQFKNLSVGEGVNTLNIALGTQPEWEMYFEIGAAQGEFNLESFRLRELELEAGAATLRVRLGVPERQLRCRIKTGAATLKLSVPESVGCELRYEGGLSSKRFEGFQRVNEKLYRTGNFATAEKKIFLKLEAGLSSVRVERY